MYIFDKSNCINYNKNLKLKPEKVYAFKQGFTIAAKLKYYKQNTPYSEK